VMMPESNEVWMPKLGKSLNPMARKSWVLNFYQGTRGGNISSGCGTMGVTASTGVDPNTGQPCVITTVRTPARVTWAGQAQVLRRVRSSNMSIIDPGDYDESMTLPKCCENEEDDDPIIGKRCVDSKGGGEFCKKECAIYGAGSTWAQQDPSQYPGAPAAAQGCPQRQGTDCFERIDDDLFRELFDCFNCASQTLVIRERPNWQYDPGSDLDKWKHVMGCILLAESDGRNLPAQDGGGCFQIEKPTAQNCCSAAYWGLPGLAAKH